MADNTLKPTQPQKSRTRTVDPVVLPDVATQAHPIIDIPADLPLANDLEAAEDISQETPEDAPVGDYVRQIQLEFDEQNEEGKV